MCTNVGIDLSLWQKVDSSQVEELMVPRKKYQGKYEQQIREDYKNSYEVAKENNIFELGEM